MSNKIKKSKNKPPRKATQKELKLPAFIHETEGVEDAPKPFAPKDRIGFAIVGLGHLSIDEILPAFQETKRAKAVALVSGSPDKAERIATQYGIAEKNIYDYENFDELENNAEIDAVYIVLPNALHREFTERGAKIGKHILCEKPMATSSEDCEKMIAACSKANVKLMIAYRIQYEQYNRKVREIIASGKFGKVKLIEGVNGQRQSKQRQWRHDKKLAGGGALPDIGLYCLNTARFLLGEEPVEISAQTFSTSNDPRFAEIEENMLFQMRFPSGALANSSTGYDYHQSKRYRVAMQTGWAEMSPAYSYEGLQLKVSENKDDGENATQVIMKNQNQFAAEIDHFADCIMNDKQPFTPGEEGLQDQRIMEALYEAAKSGKTIKLSKKIRDAKISRGDEPN